ncbi:MAG: ABC transporter ATP-binding protein, partial [Alphaproteobacteria bacterium]|nr:ABC transporter ATP-binding protein [Alphaproteobacteria bacterium]
MSQLTNDSEPTLLKLKNVSQTYIGSDNKIFTIFNNVNLEVKSGEIVSMIGRSGTGKSTLLRIIGGLDALSEGEIDSAIESDEKNFGISMIFQNAALFPWLTILENIEIGLKSLNLSEKERRSRALDAIHITGLNGFESAYPKEISEGMKQRVAIARALAVQPQILLMDDPFSNLDILTSNTLKADFLALRSSQSNRLKSVIMITNSIEDAVMISDRVLILKGAPSTIAHDLKINLPHPRSNTNHSFDTLVAEIYELMMNDDLSKIQTKTLDAKNDITKLIHYTSSTKLVGFIKALIQYDDEGINIMQDLSERLNVDIASMREICE